MSAWEVGDPFLLLHKVGPASISILEGQTLQTSPEGIIIQHPCPSHTHRLG